MLLQHRNALTEPRESPRVSTELARHPRSNLILGTVSTCLTWRNRDGGSTYLQSERQSCKSDSCHTEMLGPYFFKGCHGELFLNRFCFWDEHFPHFAQLTKCYSDHNELCNLAVRGLAKKSDFLPLCYESIKCFVQCRITFTDPSEMSSVIQYWSGRQHCPRYKDTWLNWAGQDLDPSQLCTRRACQVLP